MTLAFQKTIPFVIGSAFFILSGCKSINGTLDVSKAFTAIQEKTSSDCGSDRTPWDPPCNDSTTVVKINVGKHDASLSFPAKNRFEIEVKQDRTTKKFQVKVPSNVTIPNNGEFQIPAARSGQNFDLQGAVKTVEKRSALQRRTESCRTTRNDVVCGPNGCVPVRHEVWGNQPVEFYFIDTKQDVRVNINTKGTQEALAQFDGSQSYTEKVYTHRGFCM